MTEHSVQALRPRAVDDEVGVEHESPILRFRNIHKRFGRGGPKGEGVLAVSGVSLDVREGEFVAVVGPSGCGKSTLLNMAAGLMRPSKGEVWYAGRRINSVQTDVGYVTQKDNLMPWRTAEANVAMPLEIRGVPAAERKERVAEYLELVGLTGFERSYPAQLSGGMRKRVTLARSLVYDPDTLLMDEPFGALDAQLKLILQDELLRLLSQRRRSVVFVTHDLTEALALADRVIVFSARPGTIRLEREVPFGRPRDVLGIRFASGFGELHDELWRALESDIRMGKDV
jgi:NitT/TauT family transport system ATP-binding protein